MENTPKNNSNQSELDLGINQTDSILSKVTGLFNKKETLQPNQFAVRKEPTFGTQPNTTVTNPVNTIQNSEQTVSDIQETIPPQQPTATEPTQTTIVQTETVQVENTTETINTVKNTAEPTMSETVQEQAVPPTQSHPNNKNPENWAIMQKLPTKHRRLFIAIAGVIAILLALLWLKPSNNTIEEIQANNSSSTPIEFQSLDPNKPLENSEVVNNVEVETATVPTDNITTPEITTAPTVDQQQPTVPSPVVTPAPVKPVDTQATEQAYKAEQAKIATEQAQARKAEQAKIAAEQEQARQAEQAKVATQQARKAEQAKQPTNKVAPVVDAKPAGTSVQSHQSNRNSSTQTTASSNSTKTLVIPQNTSLFQVFRNNDLDIRDANAMTKANGAGNVLSSFKANDKVQVSVSQGHVNTMRLSDGSVFTRQADGTYKYKK
ncbi:LysM-like peptidoglycan-binding domain-containing protein [Lonepinella sp. BR2919]|uniref:LysM-like peptidoglycan-binding domain-containing protein n=1 Tax=unclassified Lonepinella TaxID=2642006 RepID=UPI003F6DFEFD